MSISTINFVKSPVIFSRRELPKEYVDAIEALGAKLIVEHWEWGEVDPTPKVDLSECDVILTLGMRDDLAVLKYAPKVKWVHSLSVGIEAMLKSNFQNSNITVTNSKGCTAIPIAEHTLAMILTFARGIPTMINNKRERVWGLIPTIDLSSITVGIIGYGEIGVAIAERAKALGMRVIGCKRNPNKNSVGKDFADQLVGMGEMDWVLGESDFLVLALPSTEQTKHVFNNECLKKMKKGSYLI